MSFLRELWLWFRGTPPEGPRTVRYRCHGCGKVIEEDLSPYQSPEGVFWCPACGAGNSLDKSRRVIHD